MKKLLLVTIIIIFFMNCKSNTVNSVKNTFKPAKVELVKKGETYRLLVNNKPFFIKGAGLEFGNIEALAKNGGNSFRTWRTENGQKSGKEVLDEAHKNGLMVLMGIEVALERHGFDYNDTIAVKKQLERIKKEVLALKDHPALLIWGIGNELNLRSTNPKVWNAVNDISKMIHEIDPNHPTNTSLAGISKAEVNLIKERCPDLDILSFQLYGKLENLTQLVAESGWKKAFIITEWGPTGHWEVPQTEWGSPIEENSTLKAQNYLMRYQKSIEVNQDKCLGSYVFLWGQKQERTPTWYGVFLENGSETESVDVMYYLWNNKWPENSTPKVISFVLNKKTAYESVMVKADEIAEAHLIVKDFDNDNLNYFWEIMPEPKKLSDGGDFEERPKSIDGLIISQQDGKVIFKSPNQKGVYRLFGYVNDGKNHTATANIPFMVN